MVAAVPYSVMACAKANQVEPFAYVRKQLVQLAQHSPPAAARHYKIENLRFDGDAAL
jgi:hypothetical protein